MGFALDLLTFLVSDTVYLKRDKKSVIIYALALLFCKKNRYSLERGLMKMIQVSELLSTAEWKSFPVRRRKSFSCNNEQMRAIVLIVRATLFCKDNPLR